MLKLVFVLLKLHHFYDQVHSKLNFIAAKGVSSTTLGPTNETVIFILVVTTVLLLNHHP